MLEQAKLPNVMADMPIGKWPDRPSHAVFMLDNWRGESIPSTVFAFEVDGVLYHHENGAPILQYVGDQILKQWPLV